MVGCISNPRSHIGPKVPLLLPADRLVKLDTVETLNDATMRHVQLVDSAVPKLVLNDPTNSEYPRFGIWESSEQEADFGFTQMIPSWNVSTPAGTGVRFFVRTRDVKTEEWSPWLYVGYWGHSSPINALRKFPGGVVDEDTVKLNRPANAWQIRATLESFETDVKINPSVRRISVVYSGMVADDQMAAWRHRHRVGRAGLAVATTEASVKWAIDLRVPYRAQGDTPEALQGQTCSPTSVSMVLEYWGKNIPTTENAIAIWDEENRMFGNWDRAVARAGELRLDAWVTRYRNWDQVKATIASGQPIIASIRFKEGEFPSSILASSAGHLIVIRGMTASGDLICNDPGNRIGNGIVYKASELGHAWFDHGGAAYIIHGEHAIVAPRESPEVVKRMVKGRMLEFVPG